MLADKLEALVSGAHDASMALCAEAPPEIEGPADDALIYWSVARRLLEPLAHVPAEIEDRVAAEVTRINEATFIGKLPGDEYPHDYTVYKPIAGYERSEEMRRYFRCNRFLTLTPVRFRTVGEVLTCALVALALGESQEAWEAYLGLSEFSRFLAGDPEDISPADVLVILRSFFGETLTLEDLTEQHTARELASRLRALGPPSIADQPQDQPGADALLGWGLRVLPPGVTVRASAFQRLGEAAVPPYGKHIIHLLGNDAVSLPEEERRLLIPAGEMLALSAEAYESGLDVHTSSLVTLSKLSHAGGSGYPTFMNSPAWALKTANTQLGAWSQIEHDVFLYAKDTAHYLGHYRRPERFHGYVEPVPEYYAALATLVARTRDLMESLDLFRKIAPPDTGDSRLKYLTRSITVTAGHFEGLESMLGRLITMSRKELEGEPFDRDEIGFLKRFGVDLKQLGFNESNLPHAHEPMSLIVRIVREYLTGEGLYVGTGRPLRILVIVPYQGELHWSTGAVYSYYEFMHPLSDPITDERWKAETASAFAGQPHRPWLLERGVGLSERVFTRKTFTAWLPEQTEDFGRSYGGRSVAKGYHITEKARRRLDELGFVTLDEEAGRLAAMAFSGYHFDQGTRFVLYELLKSAPGEMSKVTGLKALGTIISEVRTGAPLISRDYRLWTFLSLRLLKDTSGDAAVKEKIKNLAELEDAGEVLKECADDPEVRALLERLGLQAG